MTNQIPGGCFLIANTIFRSAIWGKPPQTLRLFILLIGKAAFSDGYIFKGHVLKRGELITTYGELAGDLSYTFNRALITPSIKEIRIVLSWLQSEGMILMKPMINVTSANKGRPTDLTRAYVGLLISIINYDTYQNLKSYKGSDKGRPSSELGQLRTIHEKKITPEEILSEISSLSSLYNPELLETILEAVSSSRKSFRIADSVKLRFLQACQKYSVDHVQNCFRLYLEKGYAEQGKDEKYLMGIIRKRIPEVKKSSW